MDAVDCVTDADFNLAARNALAEVGDPTARKLFYKVYKLWVASIATSGEDDGIGDVDLRQMAAARLLTYRSTWQQTNSEIDTADTACRHGSSTAGVQHHKRAKTGHVN